MDDGAKNELKAILGAYKARLIEAQDRETKLRTARASFIDVFRVLKAERIGPVLEDFVVQLNAEGHQASVLNQEEQSDRNGQFTPSSITLRLIPERIGDSAGAQSSIGRIEVTFSANQHTMKVVVSSTNNPNGTMGKRGEYDLTELTKGFVVSNVLKTIREALATGK